MLRRYRGADGDNNEDAPGDSDAGSEDEGQASDAQEFDGKATQATQALKCVKTQRMFTKTASSSFGERNVKECTVPRFMTLATVATAQPVAEALSDGFRAAQDEATVHADDVTAQPVAELQDWNEGQELTEAHACDFTHTQASTAAHEKADHSAPLAKEIAPEATAPAPPVPTALSGHVTNTAATCGGKVQSNRLKFGCANIVRSCGSVPLQLLQFCALCCFI